MNLKKYHGLILSDRKVRNGQGILLSVDDRQIMEIFRDDDRRIVTIKLLEKEITLDDLETGIEMFRDNIGQDFQ